MLALLNPKGRTIWRKEKHSLWGLLFSNEYRQSNPLNPQMLFAGQWLDEESGLAYNRFRYYDPESVDYISSDPIGLQGGEKPYSYVDNPMGWVDPFGLAKCPSKYSHLTREQRQARINELAEANAQRRLQEMQSQNPRSHFLDRHGAQTTLQQQKIRSQTGSYPEGGRGKVPAASTRFLSYRDQLNAIQRAQIIHRSSGGGRGAIDASFSSTIGEGYTRQGSYIKTNNARTVFNDQGHVITAFPTP